MGTRLGEIKMPGLINVFGRAHRLSRALRQEREAPVFLACLCCVSVRPATFVGQAGLETDLRLPIGQASGGLRYRGPTAQALGGDPDKHQHNDGHAGSADGAGEEHRHVTA